MHVFLRKKTVQLCIAGNFYYIIYSGNSYYISTYIDIIVTVQLLC